MLQSASSLGPIIPACACGLTARCSSFVSFEDNTFSAVTKQVQGTARPLFRLAVEQTVDSFNKQLLDGRCMCHASSELKPRSF